MARPGGAVPSRWCQRGREEWSGVDMSVVDIELTPRDRERGDQLQQKLVEFGRLLWDMGLDVGPGRLIEASEIVSLIDIRKQQDFYDALKCCLLARHEQEPLFNQAFFYFWQLKHHLNKMS